MISLLFSCLHSTVSVRVDDPVLTNNQGVMEANTLEAQNIVWDIRVNPFEIN